MQELLEGNANIMFSAPHCVDHFREGKKKVKETNTGTIVKELNKIKNVPAIYKTKSEFEDANWDKESKYKEECKEYILKNNVKYFIDIHGMNYEREEDICIGTAYGRNILNREDILAIIVEQFKEYGYKNVSIDIPFNALNKNCVSSYVSRECKIPAFQIEINNKYRFPLCKEYNLENIIKCFESIIDKLQTI